jgi:integrase
MTHLFGPKWIAAMLLFGAGLRLMECLQLRVKDIDFGYRQITVRGGKGNRNRITFLPATAETRFSNHLEAIRWQHEDDLKNYGSYVKLPSARAGKYPGAARGWGWRWVFPSYRPYKENVTGHLYRHHLFETVLQKAIRDALPAPPILPLSKTSLPFHPSDADKKIVHPRSRLLMENTADPAAYQDSTYGA